MLYSVEYGARHNQGYEVVDYFCDEAHARRFARDVQGGDFNETVRIVEHRVIYSAED